MAHRRGPEHNGAGLSTTAVGLRLRYEFRREVAPYIGVAWSWKHGRTADVARAAGDETAGARFVTGVRLGSDGPAVDDEMTGSARRDGRRV